MKKTTYYIHLLEQNSLQKRLTLTKYLNSKNIAGKRGQFCLFDFPLNKDSLPHQLEIPLLFRMEATEMLSITT
jgi:hypothetical protein